MTDATREALIRLLSDEVSDDNGDGLDDRTLTELADKVLAVVRPAVAAAVLARVQSLTSTPLNDTTHQMIALEFGVDQ